MGYYITRYESLNNFKDEVLKLMSDVYGLNLDVSVWEEKQKDMKIPQIEIELDIEDDALEYISDYDYVKEDSWDFVGDNVSSYEFQKILKDNGLGDLDIYKDDYVILNTEVNAFKNCEIVNINNNADIDRFIDVMKQNNFMR